MDENRTVLKKRKKNVSYPMTFQTDGEEDFIMIGEIFLCVGLQTQPHLHILFHNLKSQPNRS